MCNADREFEIQYPWLMIGYFAFVSVALCVYGLAVAFGAVSMGPGLSSLAVRIGISCFVELGGVFLGFAAIRWTTRRIQQRQRLIFTDTAVVFTEGMSPWSRTPISVPYVDLKKARYTTLGQMRTIKIAFAGGRFIIDSTMLPRKEEFDDLLNELTRRLKSFDVEVETREYSLRRAQFSLRFMLIVTAVVAAGLGFRSYLGPEFQLFDLIGVLGCILSILISTWLIFSASSTARIFAIGFMLGMILEWHSVWLFLGGGIPQGPYSSTLICQQMLMAPGNPPIAPVDLIWAESFWWLVVGGTLTSGIVGGTALLLIWLVVKRVIGWQRGGETRDRPASSD